MSCKFGSEEKGIEIMERIKVTRQLFVSWCKILTQPWEGYRSNSLSHLHKDLRRILVDQIVVVLISLSYELDLK